MKRNRLEKKNMDLCKSCRHFLINEENKCCCENTLGGGGPIRHPWATLNGNGVWKRLAMDEFERSNLFIHDTEECPNCK